MTRHKRALFLIIGLLLLSLMLSGCQSSDWTNIQFSHPTETSETTSSNFEYEEEPKPYTTWNNNVPSFTDDKKACTNSYESYSDLDTLNRPGVAMACLGPDLMPTEERESIGSIKPAGWHTVKYPDTIPDRYLYNRCHLIGFQLAGENANEKNLITGTRYLNIEGMLPFENTVADYIHETENHVLYRVTPQYRDNELLARNVLIEAWSVEDNGQGVCFAVLCPNIQPGIAIDYATGDSKEISQEDTNKAEEPITVILNTNSGKYHRPDCSSVTSMSKKNKLELTKTIDELHQAGYEPCQICQPDS